MTTTKLGSTPTTSKLPAVARSNTPSGTSAVTASAPVAQTAEAKPAQFDGTVQDKAAVLTPKAGHVARSADPGALWGVERKEGRPHDPELRAAMGEFRKLSPEAQKAKIEELKGMQDELSKKMLARIEVLDQRYKNMRNVTKGEMLRNLADKTDQMTPAEKQHLDGLLDKADGIAKKIEEAKAQAAAMPDSKTATPEEQAERTKLARHIKNLRGKLSDATKAATTYVDSLGLRADRLAVNEQKIDPNAPPPSSSNSLLSMMANWFQFNTLIHNFVHILNFETLMNLSPKQREALREALREEARKEEDNRKDMVKKEIDANYTKATHAKAREVEDRAKQESLRAIDLAKEEGSRVRPLELAPREQRTSLDGRLRSLAR